MKKILMTIAAAFVATAMSAQMYVGGTIGYDKNTSKTTTLETTQNDFTINPEFGFALDDKLGVGIELSYVSSTTEEKWIGVGSDPVATRLKPNSTTFSLRPYARYQMFQVGKFNLFVDGGVDFAISKRKEVGIDAAGKVYDNKAGLDLGLFLQPGIAFNVNDKWSIVAKLRNMFTVDYSKGQVADVEGAPDPSSDLSFRLASGGFTLGGLNFGVYYNF